MLVSLSWLTVSLTLQIVFNGLNLVVCKNPICKNFNSHLHGSGELNTLVTKNKKKKEEFKNQGLFIGNFGNIIILGSIPPNDNRILVPKEQKHQPSLLP